MTNEAHSLGEVVRPRGPNDDFESHTLFPKFVTNASPLTFLPLCLQNTFTYINTDLTLLPILALPEAVISMPQF